MWVDPLSKRILKGAGLIPVSKGRGPVVLMYHSVEPDGQTSPSVWSISERRFVQQLQLLRSEGWHTARVCDLLHAKSISPRTVVITFDDGYANNFENGFGKLREYDMRATWFVVTQDIGRQSSWLDSGQPPKLMLDKGQLRQMEEAGMEIAAHTQTHPHLTELDADRIWEEVCFAKNELENILGEPVSSFAYPYGEFNEKCVAAVKKAGYQIACTARPGWFGSERDLFRVRRVAIFSHDSLSKFARKIAFADSNVGWNRMAKYTAGRIKSRLRRD